MNARGLLKSLRVMSLMMCGKLQPEDVDQPKMYIEFVRSSYRRLTWFYINPRSTFKQHWNDCFGWAICLR